MTRARVPGELKLPENHRVLRTVEHLSLMSLGRSVCAASHRKCEEAHMRRHVYEDSPPQGGIFKLARTVSCCSSPSAGSREFSEKVRDLHAAAGKRKRVKFRKFTKVSAQQAGTCRFPRMRGSMRLDISVRIPTAPERTAVNPQLPGGPAPRTLGVSQIIVARKAGAESWIVLNYLRNRSAPSTRIDL